MSQSDRSHELDFEAFASAQDDSSASTFGPGLSFEASASDSASKLDWLTPTDAPVNALTPAAPIFDATMARSYAAPTLSEPSTSAAAPKAALPALTSSPPSGGTSLTGSAPRIINYQYVTNTIDFSTTNQSDFPTAPGFNFKTPASLWFSTGVSKQFTVLGVPCSFTASLFGGLKGSLTGSLGTYSIAYPVEIAVSMARDVTDGDTFAVDPQLIGVDDAQFTMNGPSASASVFLGFGAKATLSIGSGGSILSVHPSFTKGTGFGNSYKVSIDAIPGLSISLDDPTPYSDSATGSSTGSLAALSVSGAGNNFLSGTLDVIKTAITLLNKVLPGIDVLDQTINFDVGKISYAIASLPLQVGLKLGQELTLTSGAIQESLQAYVDPSTNPGQWTPLGSPVTNKPLGTTLNVTAPSSGEGEIEIIATYTDTFTITSETGFEADVSLTLNGPSASGSIFGIPFSIGPLGTLPLVPETSSTLIPILNHTTTSPTLSGQAVYDVYYGFADVVAKNGFVEIGVGYTQPPGNFVLDDDSTIIFDLNAPTISNDIDVDDNVSIEYINSTPYVLDSTFTPDGASSNLRFYGGGDIVEDGQILVTGKTEITAGILDLGVVETSPGDFLVDSGATLEFAAGSSSIGSLEGAGTVSGPSSGAVTLTVGSDNESTTFSGTFSDPGVFNLTKVGTGQLYITSNSLYNGLTEVEGGILDFGGSAVKLGQVDVLSPGVVAFVGSSATLGNLYGSGNVDVANGVSLTFGASSNLFTVYSGHINQLSGGASSVTWKGVLLELENTSNYTGATYVDDGLVAIVSTSTTGVSASLASPSIVIAKNADFDYSVSDQVDDNYVVSAKISGAGELTFTTDGLLSYTPAVGIVALTGDNTYTGGTLIDSGIVELGNAFALSTGTVTIDGAAIFGLNGVAIATNALIFEGSVGLGNVDLSSAVSLASNVTLNAVFNATEVGVYGAINLGAYTLTTSDTGPLLDTVSWSSASPLTLGSNISGTGGFTQDTASTTVLAGEDTYTGVTLVEKGELELFNPVTNAVQGTLAGGNVVIDSGATFAIANDDQTNDAYMFTDQISGSGTFLLKGGADSVTTLVADDAPGFTGTTFIANGIVNVLDDDIFGTGEVFMSGGALRATQYPAYISNDFDLLGSIGLGAYTNLLGSIDVLADVTVTASENAGNSVWSGAVDLFAFTLTMGDTGTNTDGATWAGDDLTITGVVSGSGAIVQDSSGGLVLDAANTYTGGTTVSEGFLTVGSASALGTGSLTVNNATVNFNGSYTIANNVVITGGVTFNIAAGDDVTLTGALSTPGGGGAINVMGGGTLTLEASSDSVPDVTVDAGGTLIVDSAQGAPGQIDLQANATLIVGNGDTGNIQTFVVTSDDVLQFGVIANEIVVAYGALGLYENYNQVLVVQEDGYNSTPYLLPVYSGAKLVGTDIVMTLPDAVSVLGFKENQSSYGSEGVTPNVVDSAARIEANLAYLSQSAGLYGSITASDTPISVSLSNYNTYASLLDGVTGGFFVADTAANILGDLSALNTDSDASLDITSGSGTMSSGQTVTASRLTVGATAALTLAESFTYSGAFTTVAKSTVTVSSGDTLTLKGSSTLAGAINGAGPLVTTGSISIAATATIAASKWTLYGSATVNILGNLVYAGPLLVNSTSTILVAQNQTFTLEGTANISGTVGGFGALTIASGTTNLLSSATLETVDWTVSGTGVATIAGELTYGGLFLETTSATVNILANEQLTLQGTSTIEGDVKGAGLLFLQGNTTISGGAQVKAATWVNVDGTVTLAKGLSYIGEYILGNDSELTLAGSGASLSLSGTSTFYNATVDGSGTMRTAGPTTVEGLTIGGTVDWTNAKTITQYGASLTLGDADGDAATLTNAKSGVYDIVDGTGVSFYSQINAGAPVGNPLSSIIVNAGLLEKTGGSGDSVIEPNITNAGRIYATSGELELGGDISGTGSIQVSGGAMLQLDGDVASTQTLVFGSGGGEFLFTDLNTYGVQPFRGKIHGWATNDSLDLGAFYDANATFSFAENAAANGGVLTVSDQGLSSAITFNGLSGVVATANFSSSLDSNGATVLTYHS